MHPSGPPSHNSFGNWGGLVLLYEFRRQQFNHSSPYQKGSTCHASVLSRKVHLGKVSARLLEGVQLLPVVNDICKLVHQHDALPAGTAPSCVQAASVQQLHDTAARSGQAYVSEIHSLASSVFFSSSHASTLGQK